MTRTKKARAKKYPKPFTVRATKDEHERLMNRAREAQLSLSRFLVECGLSKNAPSWEDKQRHERAILQLVRTGNNLNQIAKQLNAQSGVLDYANLELTLRNVERALQQIEDFKR
jgi:DNA-binding NarL/FixJ family response regulator